MERREFLRNSLALGVTGFLTVKHGMSLSQVTGVSEPRDSHFARASVPLRPPGALPEKEFLARCIRCMRCVDNCPNNAIIALDESYGRAQRFTPAIKARRQACMLCNKLSGDGLKCTEACPTGALQLVKRNVEDICAKVKMGTAEIDTALCYSYNNWSCGTCYRACPLPGKAMTLGRWERPEVHAEHCIGCGACERICIRYPQAIRVKPRELA